MHLACCQMIFLFRMIRYQGRRALCVRNICLLQPAVHLINSPNSKEFGHYIQQSRFTVYHQPFYIGYVPLSAGGGFIPARGWLKSFRRVCSIRTLDVVQGIMYL